MVYIDYSEKDTDTADRIREVLEANGVTCFFPGRDAQAGEKRDSVLSRGMSSSAIYLPLITGRSVADRLAFDAAQGATVSGKPVLPYVAYEGRLPAAYARLARAGETINAANAPEFVCMAETVRRIYRILGAERRQGVALPGFARSDEKPLAFTDSVLERALHELLGRYDALYPSDVAGVDALDLTGRGICDVTSLVQFPALRELSLRDNNISFIEPIAALRTLETLDLSDNNIGDVTPLSRLANLRELHLDGNGASAQDVAWLRAALPGVMILTMDGVGEVYGGRVVYSADMDGRAARAGGADAPDDAPLTGLEPAFERAARAGGADAPDDAPLTGLEPAFERALRDELGFPEGERILRSDARSVESLDLSGRGLADVSPLCEFASLKALYLHDNAIRDLTPLSGLHGLEVLSLSGNGLSDLGALAQLSNLRRLWINGNRVRDLSPLRFLTRLVELYAQDNDIDDIEPIAGLDRLTTLSLRSNRIHDLAPLARMTLLETLWLYDNRIVSCAPLSGLRRLREVYMHDNFVDDVTPLLSLSELAKLWIGNNKIATVLPLRVLGALREVRCDGNPLTSGDVERLRACLPGAEICG